MVEPVKPLDGVPQREVAGEQHVGPVEREDQEPVRRPRADAGHLGEGGLDLVVGHLSERVVRAGAQPVTWVALAVELQRDWAREETVADVIEIVLTERLLKT